MTLESWNSLFQFASVGLIALSFIAGAGALYTSDRINKRQSDRLASLETDLTAAKSSLAIQQERAANAEMELLALSKGQAPRILDRQVFMDHLRGSRRKPVEILYKDEDEEAYGLAIQIRRWLGPGASGDGLGWTIVRLRPLRAGDAIMQDPDRPTVTNSGFWLGHGGIGLVVRTLPAQPNPFKPSPDDDPTFRLLFALQRSGLRAATITEDASLPTDLIRLIVGPK